MPKRLDESFSSTTWKKSLTGDAGVEIDLSKLTISQTGEIQPSGANELPAPPHPEKAKQRAD
jgi:hypothetical protein